MSYEFTLDHPPLLSDFPQSWFFSNSEVAGPIRTNSGVWIDTTKWEGLSGVKGSVAIHGRQKIGITITRQNVWRCTQMPFNVMGEEQHVRGEMYSTTVTELESLQTTISASVGGVLKAVTAEISAEVSHTKERETAWTEETWTEKTVTLQPGKIYATWQLEDRIHIHYPQNIVIKAGWLETIVGIPEDSYTLVLSTYNDSKDM